MNAFQAKLITEVISSERYSRAKKKIRRYWKGSIQADDLEGDFNEGIMEALQVVRPDIGTPMEYLMNRGFRHVQMKVRREMNHTMIEQCNNCKLHRPYRGGACKRCKGVSFSFHSRVRSLDHKEFSETDDDEPCAKRSIEDPTHDEQLLWWLALRSLGAVRKGRRSVDKAAGYIAEMFKFLEGK